MNLDIAIKKFASFLSKSFNTILPLLKNRIYTDDESSIADWMQANWEVLVESNVLSYNERLEVYAAGADFNGASSRITFPDAYPTHKVLVKPKNEETFDYLNKEKFRLQNCRFEELVSMKKGFYHIEPNFDYVLITDDKTERVLKLDDVYFELGNVES